MEAYFEQIPPLEIGRKGQWILHEDLIYISELAGTIVVPKGFETDLASIPQILTPVFPKNDDHRPAAIVHDYLCRLDEVERSWADRVFLEAMKVNQVFGWRRWLMFLGVRIGAIFTGKG